MGQPPLSDQAKRVVASAKDLSLEDLRTPMGQLSNILAAEVAEAVKTATPEHLAKASSTPSGQVNEVRNQGADQTICTAHRFKQVRAPDGKLAIEVDITRANGEQITCLLPDGARGRDYFELREYGQEELRGAALLSRVDFKTMVDDLFDAIRGLKVNEGVLQTEDDILQRAYQIVTRSVRRNEGISWVRFSLDEASAVADRRVLGRDYHWNIMDDRPFGALFAQPPAESK